jgi:ABC-type amino acid transport substrate-binding protein
MRSPSLLSSQLSLPDLHHWLLKLLFLVTASMALAQPALAEPAEIEYASPDQSVWSTRQNDLGEPDNPLLHVASAILNQAGLPWHAKTYPANRLFKNLQDGTSNFSILVQASALQACCIFSRKPIMAIELRAYWQGQKTPITNRDQLIGKSVITIRGFSYGGLREFINKPENRVTVNEASTHQAALQMLLHNRADYLIDYTGPASEVIAGSLAKDIESSILSRENVHLILAKSYPDATRVMARMESIANKLDIPKLMQGTGK